MKKKKNHFTFMLVVFVVIFAIGTGLIYLASTTKSFTALLQSGYFYIWPAVCVLFYAYFCFKDYQFKKEFGFYPDIYLISEVSIGYVGKIIMRGKEASKTFRIMGIKEFGDGIIGVSGTFPFSITSSLIGMHWAGIDRSLTFSVREVFANKVRMSIIFDEGEGFSLVDDERKSISYLTEAVVTFSFDDDSNFYKEAKEGDRVFFQENQRTQRLIPVIRKKNK